jgi:hypothetical protein
VTKYETVLYLILALLGIALLILGIAAVMGNRINTWWSRFKKARGPVAITAGALLLGGAAHLLANRTPDGAVEAIGTVSGDVITAIIAATTLYAVLLLRRSVSEQTNQLKVNALQNVSSEMLKIDRWVADNPKYLAALKVSTKAEPPECAAAVAEVYADFIAHVVDNAKYLPEGHIDFWQAYFNDIIGRWPQLDKFMADNERWYNEALNALRPDRPAGASHTGAADN